MMNDNSVSIGLKSYAKINLSLDVKGVTDDGMHLVEMVMQQILLCDEVAMRWTPAEAAGTADHDTLQINLKTNRSYLPTDERNLAYQAALVMRDIAGNAPAGTLDINIKKRNDVISSVCKVKHVEENEADENQQDEIDSDVDVQNGEIADDNENQNEKNNSADENNISDDNNVITENNENDTDNE